MTAPNLFEQAGAEVRYRKQRTLVMGAHAEAVVQHRREQDGQMKVWHAWRQAEVAEVLVGPSGHLLRSIIGLCRRSPSWTAIDEAALLRPLARASGDVQATARRVIRAFIADRRERDGLVPYDDPIGW